MEPEFHSSLQWILDNDPEPLDLTFVVEEEAFGEVRINVTSSARALHVNVQILANVLRIS